MRVDAAARTAGRGECDACDQRGERRSQSSAPRRENTVNRTELIAAIAEEADLTKVQADAFLAAFQKVLVDNVAKGEAVKITGLMGVERVERAARTGRNPRTGEEIQIPAGYGVKLTVGSALKKAVAK